MYVFGKSTDTLPKCTSGDVSVENVRWSDVSQPRTSRKFSDAGVLSILCTDGSFNPSVRLDSLTSFEGDVEVLRGVDLVKVLRSCGRLFRNSQGSESTFSMSRQVTNIFFFVSHNWSVRRTLKFFGLAFYFNFGIASATTVVCSIILGVLQATGIIWSGLHEEMTFDESGPGAGFYTVGVASRLCLFPVFAVVLLFWQDALALTGRRQPAVFVDKCCICQTDPTLMKRGIEKLSAFVSLSERMLVLYTDVYLTKLWTVYEVASFLVLHPDESMVVVPVYHTAVYCITLLVAYLSSLITMLLWLSSSRGELRWCGDFVCIAVGLFLLRKWFRQCRVTQRRFESFSIRNCSCAVDSDRDVVYSNIAFLLRASELVNADATDEQVLTSFDDLVKDKVPSAFEAVLTSRQAFQFHHYLFLGFFFNGGLSLDNLAMLAHGRTLRDCLVHLCEDLTWTLVLWPLCVCVMERVAFIFLHVKRCREFFLVVFLSTFLIMAPGIALQITLNYLEDAARTSNVALGFFVAIFVLGVVLLICVTTGHSSQLSSRNTFSHSLTTKSMQNSMSIAGPWRSVASFCSGSKADSSQALGFPSELGAGSEMDAAGSRSARRSSSEFN